MAIGINGITFVRPTVAISTQITRDSDGEAIGRIDSVTYSDAVYITDVGSSTEGKSLTALYNAAVGLGLGSNANNLNIEYPGGGGLAKFKSISLSQETDFLTKLIYSVTVECIPNRPVNSKYDSPVTSGGTRALTESSQVIVPHDQTIVTLLNEQTYCNKAVEYNYSMQVSCSSNNYGWAVDNADKILESLFDKLPDEQAYSRSNYSNYIINKANKSGGKDGSLTFSMTKLLYPVGVNNTLLLDSTVSENNNIQQNSKSRSYRLTFNHPGIIFLSDDPIFGSNQLSSIAANLSYVPFNAAVNLMNYLIANDGMVVVTASMPGKDTGVCQYAPQWTQISAPECWVTKSLSLENNLSDNRATLNIEQTTDKLNCDVNGYITNWNIVEKNTDNVVYEPQGWPANGYIVQNFNTKKAKSWDFTVNVETLRKCSTLSYPEVINMAKAKYEEISKINNGMDGVRTNYNISIKDDKCSVSATEYSGTNQSK